MKILSICIPTYNRYAFISKLINKISTFDSVILNKIDIVVSDNASSDQTEFFFQELRKKKLPYIHYYRQQENIGATQNLYQLITLANSEYIWWLGDDDWIEEQNVVLLLEKLISHKYGVVVLDRQVVLNKNNTVDSLFHHFFAESQQRSLKDITGIIGPYTLLGCISSLIFRKQGCLDQAEFDFYCSFETSHPHIGFLLASHADNLCYLDINNKITTYAERQSPEEYEHNKILKTTGSDPNKRVTLVNMLAVGLPNMYSALITKHHLSVTTLSRGKEFLWGEKESILTSIHADMLLGITILSGNLTMEKIEQAVIQIKKIYRTFPLLSKLALFRFRYRSLPTHKFYSVIKSNYLSGIKYRVFSKLFFFYVGLMSFFKLGKIK